MTSAAAKSAFDDASTFRIVNFNVIETSEDWAVMTSIVYEDLDSSDFDGTARGLRARGRSSGRC